MTDRERELTEIVRRERARLGSFIRRRVSDPGEAEDILQDVFEELVQAYRLPEQIEQLGAWLFRVARNRIIDRFRRAKHRKEGDVRPVDEEDDADLRLDLELPSLDQEPDALYARSILLEALIKALDGLPADQRDVFVAHELEGRNFKELSAEWGVGINTLLARKRYAVLRLRSELRAVYDELEL